jgi:hypothetical protein
MINQNDLIVPLDQLLIEFHMIVQLEFPKEFVQLILI